MNWRVLDPSSAVSRLTHLALRKLIVLSSPGPEDNELLGVDSINYAFGQVPHGIEKVGPPRNTPTFLEVAEYRRKQSQGAPFVERTIEHVGDARSRVRGAPPTPGRL